MNITIKKKDVSGRITPFFFALRGLSGG